MDNQTAVREKYGSIARSVTSLKRSACCDPAMRCCDPITKDLYSDSETGTLPEKALLASLGCGNPTALIELRQVRRYWISALAAALMYCSQRNE